MTERCDLHTHSVFSDGTYTPSQLIDEAICIGLSAVALCDHNTADGLPDFLAAAAGKPIEAIPGAEFSVDYDGTELHLLGLFIQPEYFPQVTELMEDVIARKEACNIALVESLNKADYHLDYDAIKRLSPTGKINRSHIARELTRLGYTKSVKQAFKDLLCPEAGYYQEPERLKVRDMIGFLRSIRAVPVLAHPFLNLSEEALKAFLPQARDWGLVGMETAYSLYSPATTATATALAEQFGLKPSGGSDFHGTTKPDICLGTGKGNLSIPRQWADELKAART